MSLKKDRLERVAATAVEAVLGVTTAAGVSEAVDLGAPWNGILAAVLTTCFALLKTWAAKHVGDPESASLVKG